MNNDTIHPFEKAGLGLAPFRFVGVEKKLFTIPGVPEATKPGSCCDYCYTAITYEYWLKSADGKRFKVGSDCIKKTLDQSLVSQIERTEARLKLEQRHAAEAERNAAAKTTLEGTEMQSILASMPHPYTNQAAQGMTRLDWANWMMSHAGNKGKLDVAKFIEKINKGKIDISTPERRTEEAQKLADTKARLENEETAKRQAEEDRRNKIAYDNNWLVELLTLHLPMYGENFVTSIINQLTDARWCVRFQDLSQGQKNVVADILAKEEGRRNSRAYDQRRDEILTLLS